MLSNMSKFLKRVVHRPGAVLGWVHPSSTGDKLQNFLVAFARVWHVSEREDLPQQHSEGPVRRTGDVEMATRAHTQTRALTHTCKDTHGYIYRCVYTDIHTDTGAHTDTRPETHAQTHM